MICFKALIPVMSSSETIGWVRCGVWNQVGYAAADAWLPLLIYGRLREEWEAEERQQRELELAKQEGWTIVEREGRQKRWRGAGNMQRSKIY